MNNSDAVAEREALFKAIDGGDITIGEAVKRMRKITGMNQKDYAKNILGIPARTLSEIERDQSNPTIATLNRIGRPFGLVTGFVRSGDTDS